MSSLLLKRRKGQTVIVTTEGGEVIEIKVLEIKRDDWVHVRVTAAQNTIINRGEVEARRLKTVTT